MQGCNKLNNITEVIQSKHYHKNVLRITKTNKHSKRKTGKSKRNILICIITDTLDISQCLTGTKSSYRQYTKASWLVSLIREQPLYSLIKTVGFVLTLIGLFSVTVQMPCRFSEILNGI